MIEIAAPAKVNLCLDVLKRLPSGYHQIKTVFYPAYSLSDLVKISTSKDPDNVSMDGAVKKHLPKMENNLAFKALKLFKKQFKIVKNAQIEITKNIPAAAGLGGASSNTAAVLKGLNTLFGVGASLESLAKLGSELGADVPFFIYENPAIGTNLGDKIEPIKTSLKLDIEVMPQATWPELPVENLLCKTGEMYNALELTHCGKNTSKTELLIRGLKENNIKLVLENLHNDFETLVKAPMGLHLSGSGPAVFSVKASV